MEIKNDLIKWSKRDLQLKVYDHDIGLRGVFVVELDDIAWILNLRGSDTEFSPMFYAYLYIDIREVVLFVDNRRADFAKIRDYLANINVQVKDYNKLLILKFLTEKKQKN